MWSRIATRFGTLPPIIATVPTQAQGAAISVIRGMDNECVTFTSRFGEPVEKAYIDAVQQGYLPESTLDTALIRLFTARMKLGMFDPPEMVPYTKIDEKELDSAEHRALARKLANESMVLLKNDGLLPLKPGIKKIAVVGPLADQTRPLIGNYAGQPTHIVSVMEGLKAEFPNATITYVPGTQFLRTDGNPVPDNVLTTPDGKPGLKADYSEADGPAWPGASATPIVSRTEANVNLTDSNLACRGCRKENRWRAAGRASSRPPNPATTLSAFAPWLRKTHQLTTSKLRWWSVAKESMPALAALTW